MSVELKDECPICLGMAWVCENHPGKPWAGVMEAGYEPCCGGAGVPCGSCNPCGGRDDPPDMPLGFEEKGRL